MRGISTPRMKTYPWGPRTWGTRNFVGEFAEDGLSFFACQAGDVGCGIFVGERVLGDVGGVDLEGVACLGEEFAAAGRGGGEDEHREIIAGAAELASRRGE